MNFPCTTHLYSNHTDFITLVLFQRGEMAAFYLWLGDALPPLFYHLYKLRQMMKNCRNSSCTVLIQLSEVNSAARRQKTYGVH